MSSDGQYLEALQDHFAKHRVMPSYAAIGKLVGLRSKASVAEMVERLKTAGFLESAADRRLRPGKRFFERPFAEAVRAGRPDLVTSEDVGALGIDGYLVPKPSNSILIRVKGDSMIDAGILPDDIAVVDRRRPATDGDIVVAIVDNELTLKRLAHEKGHAILRPENKAYPVIRPKGSLEIFGVMVGLVRKYR